MSDTYIVTAKTIDEAIAKANKLYADADHEISYDILEMPKKGFLGIGAKEAMLKVTVTETRDADLGSIVSELKSMKLHTDRDGGRENDSHKEKQPEKKKQTEKPQQNQPKSENKQNNKPQNQQKTEQKVQPKGENKAQQPKQPQGSEQKPEQKAQQNKPQQPKAENKQNNKPQNHSKPEQKAEEKSAATAETKSTDKSANVIPKEHTEVIVSAPVGLFDLPEKEPQKGWGRTEKAEVMPTEEPAGSELDDAAEETEAGKDNVKVAVSEEEMQYALDFANTLLRNMQVDARAERGVCPEGETFETTEDATVYPRIEIVGDGTGILIGHHGETLDAIQYLVNLSAIRKTRKTGSHGDYVKIVVDVENYRSKREETLRALARRMASRAVKSKRNVFLEPMNAYERRIIHSELQNYADVSTHSVGSDKNRKIIITYEGADKQPASSRRRGQRNSRPDAQRSEKQGAAKQTEKRPAEKTERPRPKKPQKIAIEQLPDFLAARSTEPDEVLSIED